MQIVEHIFANKMYVYTQDMKKMKKAEKGFHDVFIKWFLEKKAVNKGVIWVIANMKNC